MPSVDLIVLASSRKYGGRCVAGIAPRTGEWMRPVSDGPHGALDTVHTKVARRQLAELDVVRFNYVSRLDNPAQPENVLVDERPWELLKTLSPAEAGAVLRDYIEPSGPLFGNLGKAVPATEAAEGLESSLALIEPSEGVVFRLRPAEETYGKLVPRVSFRFGGREQELSITDYVVDPAVRAAGIGDHTADDLGFGDSRVVLTISLAEPKGDWCTKLVAGVLFLRAA